MPSLTPGQIVDALARNEASRLVGTTESEQVDFKLAPYILTENHQKWELVKDVAAFANRRGGAIIVGVECERDQNSIIETVVAIRPLRKALVDLLQYRSIIDAWIYPRPEGIDLRWYPPDASQESGLLLIEVPPQREGNIPYIVRDMRDPGAEFKGAVGIPRRDGERIVWDTAADIHRHMTRSLSISGSASPSSHAIGERATARISDLEQRQGWNELPVYFLQALPPDGSELQGFYDEVRDSLVNHQVLREIGFAHWRNAEVEASEGGWLAHGSDVVTWVEPDGLLTQGLLVSDNSVLGWYYNDYKNEADPLFLHPIAVVEVTLEFFRFLYSQIKPRVPSGRWRYRISCRRFQSGHVALPSGHPQHRALPRLRRSSPVASSDEWHQDVNEASTPARAAFEALRRFYALFGYPPTAIPLVENNSVSEDALTRLN